MRTPAIESPPPGSFPIAAVDGPGERVWKVERGAALCVAVERDVAVVGYDAEAAVIFARRVPIDRDPLDDNLMFVEALKLAEVRPQDMAVAGWHIPDPGDGGSDDMLQLELEIKYRLANQRFRNYMNLAGFSPPGSRDLLWVVHRHGGGYAIGHRSDRGGGQPDWEALLAA